MSTARITGIVLAGGRSTRFGEDKLVATVDGRTLLHRALAAVAEVVDEIVVVAGFGAPEPPLQADVGVPIIVARDAIPDGGPLAGLAAGLAIASHPSALLVGGDQPALQPALLCELLRRLSAGGDTDHATLDVVALEEDGQLRPLPVALRVATVRLAAEAARARRACGIPACSRTSTPAEDATTT